jgi:predicted O-methyltransferase YrrM
MRGGPFDLPPLMIFLDVNGDGELSAEEIANAPQVLKKLDKNGDGKLTRDELRPPQGQPGGPSRPDGRRGPPGPDEFQGPDRSAGPGQPPGPDQRPGPGQPPASGRGGMGPFGSGPSASLAAPPRPKGDAEEKILKVLDQVGQKQGRMANVPMPDGRMLRLLAETIGAKTIVEIGTSNGVSALWFSLALKKTGGKLITHEIDAERAELARENFTAAGVAGLVTIVEGDAHETVAKLTGPVDLVFIDADKEGYLDYLTKLLPLVRPGGLVLAHNMNPRMADARFVKAITTNPDLETLFYMEGGGLSITLKKR